MEIKEIARQVKLDSFKMGSLSEEIRNKALKAVSDSLLAKKAEIMAENDKDMKAAEQSGIAAPVLKRLKFDEAKLADVLDGIKSLLGLPDPLFKTLISRQLDEGLELYKVTCPIGVIGVIFEARPDALVQIATLCLKSGNCVILKGGSEAIRTNRILFEIIKEAVSGEGIPLGFITLFETRDAVGEILKCDDSIDLIIPRGSNEFVQYIMANTKIPVMGHADGICHIYVDKEADTDMAVRIIVDAKTQYVAACNAVETLLVHEGAAARVLPALYEALKAKHVVVKGTEAVASIIDCEKADASDFETEYLDYILSVKIVKDIDEAIDHVNRFGSHHTDSIITNDSSAAEKFMLYVDSAGVYHNCSTRFADGFRYGFGAEVGISTGKLHARGPVGLDGLTTYKYKLFGKGHIVDDYATGKRRFNFKEI